VLETSAFLDLGDIAYVTASKWEVGLNPGQKLGSSLVSRIGANTIALPFYVKADDNNFAIHAPVSGTDSRNDPRILNMLKESSRLIP
jgi:hypothetical protein